MGLFGTSAGGSLTLTTLLRAKMEQLPMPGAIALGTPTVDLSKTGDSLFTNAMVDNVLGTQDGFIRATALLYADGRDLRDPLLSPIYAANMLFGNLVDDRPALRTIAEPLVVLAVLWLAAYILR